MHEIRREVRDLREERPRGSEAATPVRRVALTRCLDWLRYDTPAPLSQCRCRPGPPGVRASELPGQPLRLGLSRLVRVELKETQRIESAPPVLCMEDARSRPLRGWIRMLERSRVPRRRDDSVVIRERRSARSERHTRLRASSFPAIDR